MDVQFGADPEICVNISNYCMSIYINNIKIMDVSDASIDPPLILRSRFKLKALNDSLIEICNIGSGLLADREKAFYSTVVYSKLEALDKVNRLDTLLSVLDKIAIMDHG